MDGTNSVPASLQPKEVEVVEPTYDRDDDKFEVTIKEVVRIRPQDFRALKDSFEEWRDKWE